jgi:mRNA interferase MazF
MTRDEAIPVLTRVVAVPLTTTIRGIPSELRLGPDDGMPEECVATFDTVASVAKTSLVARITTLPPERMADACDALRAATDC